MAHIRGLALLGLALVALGGSLALTAPGPEGPAPKWGRKPEIFFLESCE